tara:strand:- start:812 stop:1261 length:450 start_codon:yes stop_codon:yes gene_type:complete
MSSSDALYHGTAWPLKEGEELTYEDAPLRNFDQEIVGDYGGSVYATRNLQAAQFYADMASGNSGGMPDSLVYEVKHTGERLEPDPGPDTDPDDLRADKLTVVQEHSRNKGPGRRVEDSWAFDPSDWGRLTKFDNWVDLVERQRHDGWDS